MPTVQNLSPSQWGHDTAAKIPTYYSEGKPTKLLNVKHWSSEAIEKLQACIDITDLEVFIENTHHEHP